MKKCLKLVVPAYQGLCILKGKVDKYTNNNISKRTIMGIIFFFTQIGDAANIIVFHKTLYVCLQFTRFYSVNEKLMFSRLLINIHREIADFVYHDKIYFILKLPQSFIGKFTNILT